MFTGIIQHRGRILLSEKATFGRRLEIDPQGWNHRSEYGESIAVNGCCLTCTSHEYRLAFDVIPQTLDLTNLGNLPVGAEVNLEPCLTASSLISGHLVQGHIDGLGQVLSVCQEPVERADKAGDSDGCGGGIQTRARIRPPAHLLPFIMPQGSIAVDGVSLTIASVDLEAGVFEVALIPATLRITTLGTLRQGRLVNLEVDMIIKAVIEHLRRTTGG